MQAYQDIKAKEEQELQDIQSQLKEQLTSYTQRSARGSQPTS